jgi:hypothetical protein
MMTKSKALFSLALLLVLVAVVSARVSTNAAGTVERRVNMPYMGTGPADVVRFEPAIFWFGKVTPTVNNVDVRLWYYDEYMKIVAHVVDRRLWYDTTPSTPDLESWDAVTLYLNRDEKAVTSPTAKSNRLVAQLRHWQNGANYQAAYVGDGTNWVQTPLAFTAQSSWRGLSGPNSGGDAKGWTVEFVIPFDSLGLPARPSEGEEWRLAVALHDRDSADGNPPIGDQVWPEVMQANDPSTWGILHFGIPSFEPPIVEPQGVTTIRHGLNGAQVIDTHVGGHGNCGDGLDHWTEWGEKNWGGWTQFNVQNQWDISDYPCFSKYYVTFPLQEIPTGKVIYDAKLSFFLFGNAGGGTWGEPPDSFIQVFTVAEDWEENTLNWNNAPLAIENVAGTWVQPVQTGGEKAYEWDLSRAVAEAYATGATKLRLAVYSADGPYHTGKYFWTSDGIYWEPSRRPTLKVSWGDDCLNDCATETPLPPTETPFVPPTETPVLPTATPVLPTATPISNPSGTTIYLSLSGPGSIGNLFFDDEDILAYDTLTSSWSMFFDGSDVGLDQRSGQNIDAFHITKEGTILLSIIEDTPVAGLGKVDDSDILMFRPTSLGSNTAGSFSIYLKGSSVGLTYSPDDVDAIDMLPNGDLILSTRGSTNVGSVSAKDEDLLRFRPTGQGPNTTGEWSLYFRGLSVGLGDLLSEDIWAVSVDEPNKAIYLSTYGAFSVNGASGDGADILRCRYTNLGNDTNCTFDLYWDGSQHGINISSLSIDGLQVSTRTAIETVPTNTPESPPIEATALPTNTPLPPTNTPVPTSTPWPTNTPMPTSTPWPTNTPMPTSTAVAPGDVKEYFLSPDGNDSRSGTSTDQAWNTFERAWKSLKPGDVLTLMDGVYYQSIHPYQIGQIGNPVTVRAQNDGRAIIDGEGVRIPVHLEGYRTSYLVIEGIVARNSSGSVFRVTGSNNVFRRVSGYDANTDTNDHVFVINGNNNLVEDCVAAGTGRKMIVVFQGQNNVIRRCVADWRQWDGRNWHDCWPWGEGIELYNASNNIIENSITYGHTPRAAISLLAQGGAASNNNKILGSMAIASGMNTDGTPMVWGNERPQPTDHTCVAKIYEWPQYMSGFGVVASGGIMRDNMFQDILSSGNARYGLSFHTAGTFDLDNNRVNRATVFNNGLNPLQTAHWGGYSAGARQSELANFSSIENSTIQNIWTGSSFTSQSGSGAQLSNRYVNGVLTSQPLWPWPMESRIQAELGYSVTNLIQGILATAP